MKTLLQFYSDKAEASWEDSFIKEQLSYFDLDGTPWSCKCLILHLLNEANSTLELINLSKKDIDLLEIGGGIGFVYGYLKHYGYKITSIEPGEGEGEAGFENRYLIGKQILQLMNIDSSGWLPYSTIDLDKLKKEYDLIFSNFVLEHIEELAPSLLKMMKCLKPHGVMKHRCPNYFFPFEPHFSIPLIPFKPRLTMYVYPKLRNNPIWNGLNFVSSFQLRRIAKAIGAKCIFDTKVFERVIERLENDKQFGKRHFFFCYLFKLLKCFGVLYLLKKIPPTFVTPMEIRLSGP